jgi:hypothetical protein
MRSPESEVAWSISYELPAISVKSPEMVIAPGKSGTHQIGFLSLRQNPISWRYIDRDSSWAGYRRWWTMGVQPAMTQIARML